MMTEFYTALCASLFTWAATRRYYLKRTIRRRSPVISWVLKQLKSRPPWEVNDRCYCFVAGVCLSGTIKCIEGEMVRVVTCFGKEVSVIRSELLKRSPHLNGGEWAV